MKTEPTEALRAMANDLKYNTGLVQSNIQLLIEESFISGVKYGQSSPKVKQLEWLDDNFPYRGCSVFVDYIISNKISSYYTVILDIGTGIYINSFETIEEAKSAAQVDFEKRVMECLDL